MPRKPWAHVREQLGHAPLVEGRVGSDCPLYVERFFYRQAEATVTDLQTDALVTQLSGGQVREGERDHWRAVNLPTQSILLPKGVATHWHYTSTIDFAAFHFLEGGSAFMQKLTALARSRQMLLPLSDPLVGAAAQQIVNELHKGAAADQGFMARAASLMLEQCWRVLTSSSASPINPRYAQSSRLQAALNHIRENPGGDLSTEALARLSALSRSHFRRIFEESMGLPLHRYILGARLEQARKLMAMSSMPLAHVAQECGFSSQSHLTACFRAAHGATPAHYRSQLRPVHKSADDSCLTTQ